MIQITNIILINSGGSKRRRRESTYLQQYVNLNSLNSKRIFPNYYKLFNEGNLHIYNSM